LLDTVKNRAIHAFDEVFYSF